jgi:hypothetical protein
MKALLSFLPCKPRTRSTHSHLREPFLCAAAALLSIPGRYQETLSRLGRITHSERCPACLYEEMMFGVADHLGINEIASFLAHAGVTAIEAEGWRAWATAYVEMEIEGQPNSYYTPVLKQAKQMAIDRITQDPKWVLRSLHPAAPGNYCPECEKAPNSHSTVRTSDDKASGNADAGPSSNSRSSSITPDTLLDATPMIYDVNDEVSCGSDLDNDLRMGPG